MPKTSALAAGALLGSFVSFTAWAFPAAPAESRAPSNIILAAEGCGPGFHRGPFGHCRPNEAPHRICPGGWHFSEFRGRCVRY
jgi:hypothetical protein